MGGCGGRARSMNVEFTEQQPAGDANKNWRCCSIAFDGSNVRMIAGAYGGRLYYYNGSAWAEVQPAGAMNKDWRSCSIAFDGSNVRMIAGAYSGRLYSGYEAGAPASTGNFFLLFK